jgi:hypothetical protein
MWCTVFLYPFYSCGLTLHGVCDISTGGCVEIYGMVVVVVVMMMMIMMMIIIIIIITTTTTTMYLEF